MTQSVSKILMADDDKAYLEGLVDMLSAKGFRVVGSSEVMTAQRQILEKPFDVVITDLNFGKSEVDGVEIVATCRAQGTPVVVVSGFLSKDNLITLLNAGASYVLEKPFRLEELLKVLASVQASQGAPFARAVDQFLKHYPLTKRENEICRWVFRGLSSKDIAAQLSTTERTVKSHLYSIFKKCRVKSRSELFSLAFPTQDLIENKPTVKT